MKKASLFLIIFISISSFAQIDSVAIKKESRFKVATAVLKNSIISVPGDFSEMGHTISSDWKRTALYTGGIIGLIAADKITTGYLHDKIEPTIDYQLPRIDVVKTDIDWVDGNNAYILYPILGLYAGSIIANNEKGQVVAVNAVKAVTYSYVISHLLLKSITGRNRPQRPLNGDEPAVAPWTKDNWDFGNFHRPYISSEADGTSFPSFHATFYYSVAKVFQMEYNNYWIPYTIATGVYLADLKNHNHWVSDILIGGLVGTIIGKSVVLSSRKQAEKSTNTAVISNPKNFKMTKQLIPQVSSSMIGLHFIGSF
ncbi:phosphatase PAP2 family protein [Flavobacterium algicola]|uniref:phosphatase PAP2 family protein n=1 Tax=Flavobacterium algicola TaxID=556529 RepID=UPI001EFDFD11|nr:phosphatase PAP2 family protein [Flavobacterium algicola]MCG9792671.1 phosphatase PAP2 family protein [Flavobacterium algicola]